MKQKEMFTKQEQNNLKKIKQPLLTWYQAKKRELPWRHKPTLYKVWVSEIMLQQTRVETVKPYFKRFMETLPTIHDLANCPDDRLVKLWEGLGYYSRVRNLKKAAIEIEEKGIPMKYQELLDLPGIGTYTAGAIASIVYQEPVPAVDGNVFRVITRILENPCNISEAATKKQMESLLTPIMPKQNPGDFNQALMELGATICLPNGTPLCDDCPLQTLCKSFKHNTTTIYPVKNKKKDRKVEQRTILILINKNKIALQQRPNQGLLAGLFELPNLEGTWRVKNVDNFLNKQNISTTSIQSVGTAKHIFSHIEWHMQGYMIQVNDCQSDHTFLWVDYKAFQEEYAIPSAYQYYRDQVIQYFERGETNET